MRNSVSVRAVAYYRVGESGGCQLGSGLTGGFMKALDLPETVAMVLCADYENDLRPDFPGKADPIFILS